MSVEREDSPNDALLLVGRVARPHGIRGQVIVNPETDFLEDRFKVGQTLRVGVADQTRECEIRELRVHQGRPIVKFAGVDTMDDAEALSGLDLWVLEAEVAPLPQGTFYRHDLVGCEVRDVKGMALGRVTGVEGTRERSYLVVDGHMMIPLVEGICIGVDIAARRVTVDPPDGLADLNRPGSARGQDNAVDSGRERRR